MGYEIIDPKDFLENGAFFEKKFREKIEHFEWQQYDGQRVLVRGCGSALTPPWAFMIFVGKLAKYASAIFYGSEHDRIPVYNRRIDG